VTAAFAHLDSLEAPYVTEVHNVIWHYRDDLATTPRPPTFRIAVSGKTITFHIKPGYDQKFEATAKMYRDAYAKIGVSIPGLSLNLRWARPIPTS